MNPTPEFKRFKPISTSVAALSNPIIAPTPPAAARLPAPPRPTQDPPPQDIPPTSRRTTPYSVFGEIEYDYYQTRSALHRLLVIAAILWVAAIAIRIACG